MASLSVLTSSFNKSLNYLIFILFVWCLGVVVNNANLGVFHVFTWHILDLGNLSSGFLFIFLLAFFLCVGFLPKPSETSAMSHCLFYSFLALFTLFLFFWSGLFSFTKCLLLNANPNIRALISLLAIAYMAIWLGWQSESVVYLFSPISKHDLRSYLTINRHYPLIVLVILMDLFLMAVLFGRDIYIRIPRVIGGGQTYSVRFEGDPQIRKFLKPEINYKMLDETNNSFILLDSSSNEAIEVSKKIQDLGALRYPASNELTFLFAADIHATPTTRDDYMPGGLDSLERLLANWSSRSPDFTFLLGDMMESDSDSVNWENEAGCLLRVLEQSQCSVLVVIGNNDVEIAAR